MMKKKSIFKSVLIMVIFFQKLILCSRNRTNIIPSQHAVAIKIRSYEVFQKLILTRNITDDQIIDEEQIEIIPAEKPKSQEIERNDCLFCASGYELDSPYPIEVKGTKVQKRAHKPHKDFWHYGCFLQYVEYGNKKCPYCTYELCLNKSCFAINSFMPAERTFPEPHVRFGNVNPFISVRPQNLRSRYSGILVAVGQRLKLFCAEIHYSIRRCPDYTVSFSGQLLEYIAYFFITLYYIIMCIPRGIIMILVDDEEDCPECLRCVCSWILIGLIILMIHVLSLP